MIRRRQPVEQLQQLGAVAVCVGLERIEDQHDRPIGIIPANCRNDARFEVRDGAVLEDHCIALDEQRDHLPHQAGLASARRPVQQHPAPVLDARLRQPPDDLLIEEPLDLTLHVVQVVRLDGIQRLGIQSHRPERQRERGYGLIGVRAGRQPGDQPRRVGRVGSGKTAAHGVVQEHPWLLAGRPSPESPWSGAGGRQFLPHVRAETGDPRHLRCHALRPDAPC